MSTNDDSKMGTDYVTRSGFFKFPRFLVNFSQCPTMHLMYTLDEGGNRVYTLKVCFLFSIVISRKSDRNQKITDGGKVTKSAHPGAHNSLYFVMLLC